MVLRKRKLDAETEGATGGTTSPAEKIAGLLALIATKDMDTDDAALKLDGIGFNAREISALLDVGTNYVNVARHRKKAGGRKRVGKNAD
jgi:hypothetical protein